MGFFNRNILFWMFVFSFFTANLAKAEGVAANTFKRYTVKSAIIEYALSGAQTGTETVYIDEWGKREARYTQADMTMMGQTIKSNRLTILDGEWIYAIDLDKKSGTKIKNPMFESLEATADGDFTQIGVEMMQKMGGVKIGSEAIAGKPCDVWEIKDIGTKSWLWNTIPLKTEASMGDMSMASTAVKVAEGALIPQEKLEIPSDVQMSDSQQFTQMMERMREQEKNQEKGEGLAA